MNPGLEQIPPEHHAQGNAEQNLSACDQNAGNVRQMHAGRFQHANTNHRTQEVRIR
jgi:hypothetical protein